MSFLIGSDEGGKKCGSKEKGFALGQSILYFC